MRVSRIGLKNFRCFPEAEFDMKRITLLLGANSSGKSSVINALLAALQTKSFPYDLSLNGSNVNLGDYKSVVHLGTVSQKIGIELTLQSSSNTENTISTKWQYNKKTGNAKLHSGAFENHFMKASFVENNTLHIKAHFAFTPDMIEGVRNFMLKFLNFGIDLTNGNEDASKHIAEFEKGLNQLNEKFKLDLHFENSDDLQKNTPNIKYGFANGFYLEMYKNTLHSLLTDFSYSFISSFRLNPSRTYLEKSLMDLKVGKFGEGFEDQLLDWQGSNPAKWAELQDVLAKMNLLTELKTNRQGNGGFDIKVKIKPSSPYASLDDVGFGISQFLPIIVADLQMENDSTLIVSQPEIHLHPSVQAKFGDYLVQQINRTNKNYIIETHSEYLINHLRLLVATGELSVDDISVYYLDFDGIKSTVYPIHFHPNGVLEGAPEDFFQTYMMDVMGIALAATK